MKFMLLTIIGLSLATFAWLLIEMYFQIQKEKREGPPATKLWRISQAVKLQNQNDLAGLQQFYDYVKGVVEGGAR